MGSQSSKCKSHQSNCHIYYAVRLKNHHKVSVFDSEDFNCNIDDKNDESDKIIQIDHEEMNKSNSDISRSKLTRSRRVNEKSSERFKEAVQYWTKASRENITDAKSLNPSSTDVTKFDRDQQRKRFTMAPSKGRLSWTNLEDGSNRNVRSTAAQAGSNISIRENSIFKSKSNKGSTSSASSLNYKDSFESKSRSQNESFDSSSSRRKRSLKNIDQLDGLFETKTIYSSDNLSDCTNKTRDLDLRLKGGGLTESKGRTKSIEKSDSRIKKSETDKDLIINGGGVEDVNLPNDYIDARWQALCSSNEKEQVLVPCPTCGRKFNEEAAYRHFPICSRVKEKCSTVKSPKTNVTRLTSSSPCSPSFINVMADETLGLNDKRDETRKCKPIAFTFTRGGQKCQIPPPEVKSAIKSSEKCKPSEVTISSKNSVLIDSPVNSKKGSRNSLSSKGDHIDKKYRKRKVSAPKSEGVRKSASIWKKSVKEFKTIAEISAKTKKVKESNSSTSTISSISSKVAIPVKTPASKESRGNSNVSTCDSRVCPTCGRLSNISVDKSRFERSKSRTRKCFSGKYRSLNNKLTRSAKDMRDLDSPQSVSIKDTLSSKKGPKIESNFDSFEDKSEPCFFCGRLVRRSVLDSHSFLCERIKNIEVMISKDNTKQNELLTENSQSPSLNQDSIFGATDSATPTKNLSPKQYQLVKSGFESPLGLSQQTVTTMKCPCCSQNLDLRVAL